MIIVVTNQVDEGLDLIAKGSTALPADKEVFGDWYNIFDDRIPELQPDENLFYLAHGSERSVEGPVPAIGDSVWFVNGIQLFEILERSEICPSNYTGNIYICACKSADFPRGLFSFSETFYSQIATKYPETRVFGLNGDAAGRIPRPGDPDWKRAS